MNVTSSVNSSDLSTNYYAGFFEWDAIKVFYVCFHMLICFIGPALLYAVIWYENEGSAANYRTVINMLLSHTCWISLARCMLTRIPFVAMVCYGPLPEYACDIIILSSHYLFHCVLWEIVFWQLSKYLHIFHWHTIANMNDDFLVQFMTTENLFINFIFIFIKYMLGFHYTDNSYHICTGRHSSVNILSHMYLSRNVDLNRNIMIQITRLDLHTVYNFNIAILIMVYTTVRIWIYDKRDILRNLQNRTKIFLNMPLAEAGTNQDQYHYFQKTKSAIIDASGSLAVVILIALLLVPSFALRLSSYWYSENFGLTRALMYASIIAVPILVYCVLPFVLICSSKKMRNSILRELKATIPFLSDIEVSEA